MPSPHEIVRNFANFGGLDLRTSDLIKDRIYSTILTNSQQKETTSLEKRAGYKTLATTGGRFGLARYSYVNSTTGQPEFEVISFDTTPKKLINQTEFTINYSGSSTLVLFSIYLDSTTLTFKADLFVTSAVVLSYDLGTGIEEVTPKTLADLQSAINAIPDFNVVISGTSSLRAALLPITLETQITTIIPLSLFAYEWQNLNTTVSDPLAAINANKGNDDYENVSTVNLNQILYCGSGYTSLCKYDGQNFYLAGVPTPQTQPGTSLSATGFTDTNIRYFYFYQQIDAKGNIVESGFSPASATLSPANQRVTIVVNNILAGSGFNTNCAVVNGNQATVNTIVTLAHTMKVGDTAYLFDQVSNLYVTREVTSVGALSITINGAPVTVSNGDAISNNLRIGLIRTTAGGSEKYELVRGPNNAPVYLPNNSTAATQSYVDTSSVTGAIIPDPIITPSLPPANARYLAVHQNTLILGGIPNSPFTVFYGDIDFIEGFDAFQHSFDCQTEDGVVIRGMGSNNETLAVFSTNFEIGSTFIVAGTLQTAQFTVDLLSKNIGCVSHQTIQEADGLLVWLSEKGVQIMNSGQLPQEISYQIRPVFTEFIPNTSENYVYKRAIALLDDANQKYILFLPQENIFDSTLVTGNASRCYAYDYFRKAWYEWSNIDFAAGVVIENKQLFFQGRRSDVISGVAESYLSRFMNTQTEQDYNDHNVATAWEFGSIWESLNEQGQYKNFLRTKILSIEPSESNVFRIDFTSEINYIQNAAITSCSVNVGSSDNGYGISPYGVAEYGDPASANEPIIKLAGVKAKSCRIRLVNNQVSQNVVISGYMMEVAKSYRSGRLKD